MAVGKDPLVQAIYVLAEKADVNSWLRLLAEIRAWPTRIIR